MAVNTKIIKRRIKSVSNTRKITKAMEMVAAAKMRRAVDAALHTRTYAQLAWNILVNLSRSEKSTVPLLEARPVKRILLILITSNRGLCGSFNANIIRKTAEQLRNPSSIGRQRIAGKILEAGKELTVDIIGVGKKGAEFAHKTGCRLIASFSDFSDTPTMADSLSISQMVITEYEKKNYDKIVVAYTDFKSAVSQIAKLRQVLPVSEHDLEKMLAELGAGKQAKLDQEIAGELNKYIFEPSKLNVLETILPRLVETQVFQTLLESAASEHSARMLAMRNASDAAGDMIAELNLNFNKARQAGITQEIAEIAGGAAALE